MTNQARRGMYKLMLEDIATQKTLNGAVAVEFLKDIDTLFDGYNASLQAVHHVPVGPQQKIFDLLAIYDQLTDYDRNFLIGVAKYYAEGNQTRRQEKYLNRMWDERRVGVGLAMDFGSWLPGPVDMSDGPY